MLPYSAANYLNCHPEPVEGLIETCAMKSYYVYILECSDRSFYTGITSNSVDRLSQHQDGNIFHGYTLKRRPVQLVWSTYFNNPTATIQLEKQIKGWSRKKKQALINAEFDNLIQLSKNYTEFPKSENANTPSTGSG